MTISVTGTVGLWLLAAISGADPGQESKGAAGCIPVVRSAAENLGIVDLSGWTSSGRCNVPSEQADPPARGRIVPCGAPPSVSLSADGEPLRPGEPAALLLEVLDQPGNSALEGSIFDGRECPVVGGHPHDPLCSGCVARSSRQSDFVNAVRRLAAEGGARSTASPNRYAEWASPLAPEPHGQSAKAVWALRRSAVQLEAVANLLEEADQFDAADSLRGMAQDLRLSARGMGKFNEGPAANEAALGNSF
jgi:hypothetical protein